MTFLLVAACLVGMVVGSGLTLAVLNVQRAIPSSGLVVAVNVGVFSDSACTLNVTMIDWGTVYPGESVTRLVYVKNGGNVPLTLTLNTIGWNPAGWIKLWRQPKRFSLHRNLEDKRESSKISF